MSNLLQVFEHDVLEVDGQSFKLRHFDRLVEYNERYGNRYFAVGHRRIYMRQYVGVIQVGDLTIEILPKADRAEDRDKRKWQHALLAMLKRTELLSPEDIHDAYLRLTKCTLLDIYFDAFLTAAENLSHQGLVRKYRLTQGNLGKLKGRLLFTQQITRNLLHPERLYTAHEDYDRNNLFNQILKKALVTLGSIVTSNTISSRAGFLRLAFEDVADARITVQTFGRLRFDRSTERYRRALQLARFIILGFSPDLRGGTESVLAILFDMNRLFERFIFTELKREEYRYREKGLSVSGQHRAFSGAASMCAQTFEQHARLAPFKSALFLIPSGRFPMPVSPTIQTSSRCTFTTYTWARSEASSFTLPRMVARAAVNPLSNRSQRSRNFNTTAKCTLLICSIKPALSTKTLAAH